MAQKKILARAFDPKIVSLTDGDINTSLGTYLGAAHPQGLREVSRLQGEGLLLYRAHYSKEV